MSTNVGSQLQRKEDCESVMFSMRVINGLRWMVSDNEDLKEMAFISNNMNNEKANLIVFKNTAFL